MWATCRDFYAWFTDGRTWPVIAPGGIDLPVTSALTRPRIDQKAVAIATMIVLLSIAFAFLPGSIARISSGADPITTGTLAESLSRAFSQWWSTGEANLTTEMERVVMFWGVFHFVKMVVSAGLLAALLLAGAQLLCAYSGSKGRGRRAAIVIVGVLGAPWAMLILLILLANIQGAISPLSSVMGLLPLESPSEAVTQVRDHFANGTTTPVLDVLIEDFRKYHEVMVGCAAIAAGAVVIGVILALIRRMRTPPENVRLRRLMAVIVAALTLFALFLILIMLLNMSTVDETAPALAAFFEGGSL